MKRAIKTISVVAILLVGFASCNKTQINSKRLIKAGNWNVTELSVAGANEAELPMWEIKDCDDIYAAPCEGHWKNAEGGETSFIWQFRDKGETFEISHQVEEEGDHSGDHDHASEEVAEQAYNFSGVYTVVERKKDMMQFETTAALGHSGQQVVIKIEKM